MESGHTELGLLEQSKPAKREAGDIGERAGAPHAVALTLHSGSIPTLLS